MGMRDRGGKDFVAIDVETANANMYSICQIGVAEYVNGKLSAEWSSFVDPEDYFDDMNVFVHGITEDDVEDAPTFETVFPMLQEYLNDTVAVCHTHFDRVSIAQAAERYALPPLEVTWLDSARVARRAWEEFAWGGYGLANVCSAIGYEFKHHDALEDAKAAAHVLLAAIDKTGLDVNGWITRVERPIFPGSGSASVSRDGNPEGGMYGEVMVFTGALQIPRREAADLAASIGCNVSPNVTKKTTILVVGDQDISKFRGSNQSRKYKKAMELIQHGQKIRVIGESDFKRLIASGSS